ncbi:MULTISPECIES: DUF4190 domain-containing protein [unclassified Nonomuraea]|uniref:DUF4190 domain-containing protein n=1 Tax=unclassified Nonomuraea TaxID=2593643 RepID=UPI0033F536C2
MHSPYEGGDHRPPPHPHPTQPSAPTSGIAVASLIFGIIGLIGSWCLFGIPSIVAIVLGHAAARKTKQGIRPGHGMAVAGLVLGYIVAVPAFLISAFVILTRPAMVADWVNTVFDLF